MFFRKITLTQIPKNGPERQERNRPDRRLTIMKVIDDGDSH